MNVEFAAMKKDECFKNIQDYIDVVKNASKKDGIGNFLILEHHNAGNISESLELFLKER